MVNEIIVASSTRFAAGFDSPNLSKPIMPPCVGFFKVEDAVEPVGPPGDLAEAPYGVEPYGARFAERTCHTLRYLRNAKNAASAGISRPIARTSGSFARTASQPMKLMRLIFSESARPWSIMK
ncbi:hypothetical protein SALBM135S_02433 [Streptomyces alboniger]